MYKIKVIMNTGKEYIILSGECGSDMNKVTTRMFGNRADSFCLSNWQLDESDESGYKYVVFKSSDVSSLEYNFG